MPNTMIPPFQAQGSSNPAERSLHPPLWQQILEGLLAGGVGFAGGFRGGQGGGNPLLGYELVKQMQGERMGNVQNQILGQIIGQGTQLGQTPQDVTMNIPSINLGGMGQTLPASPSAPNPAYQQLIDKILQGSQQFAQLGGDPNQLVNALTKTGVMESPGEKIARINQEGAAKRATTREQNLSKYRTELIRLGNERNEIGRSTNQIRTKHLKIVERAKGGIDEKTLAGIRQDALEQYYKQKQIADRQANNQYLAATYNQDNPPSFEEWSQSAGIQPFPDADSFVSEWVKSVIPENTPIKAAGGKGNPNAKRIQELEKKIDSGKFTPAELKEYEQLVGGK